MIAPLILAIVSCSTVKKVVVKDIAIEDQKAILEEYKDRSAWTRGVLEDMGEVEAAKILVGGLIASGKITDPYELNFLQNKIRTLEEKVTKIRQDVDK